MWRKAINHLLLRESWARLRLVQHSDKTVELVCGDLFSAAFRIGPSGLLEAPANAFQPDVRLTLQPSDLRNLTSGPGALLRTARIEGEVGVAEVLAEVFPKLAWRPGDDLVQWLACLQPDVAAVASHRLDRFAQQFGEGARSLLDGLDGSGRFASALGSFGVTAASVDVFASDVAAVEVRVSSLEARLARLSH